MSEAPAAIVVAVARERSVGERRVAVVPRAIAALRAAGAEVRVEAGAGAAAGHDDGAYAEAGAAIVGDVGDLLQGADLLLAVGCPPSDVVTPMRAGAAVAGLLRPLANRATLATLAERRVDALSLELLPRITRAQDMDALSSMSTVAGYHAMLMAAVRLPRFMPLLMTSAGTIRPARVLVVGAGVAGLQAIATARRLGAVVEAFDVRPVAREQVESLGARFVDAGVEAAEVGTGYAGALSEDAEAREREVLGARVAEADAVITTALVAGGAAPRLLTAAMVEGMRAGSVIVDLAADGGGNCELTVPGRELDHHGVLVCGPTDLGSRMATDASQLYSHNLLRFTLHHVREGRLVLDMNDEITGATCVVHAGALRGPLASAPEPALASGSAAP